MAAHRLAREHEPPRPAPRPADEVALHHEGALWRLAGEADPRAIHVEGDPRSPINEGTLCPKGAATLDLLNSPLRLNQVLHRAPGADHWEPKPLDWAMERIAFLTKRTRDETFVERLPNGKTVNHTLGLASLGGATLDNEENYLIKKLFGGGLGMVWIENQARV